MAWRLQAMGIPRRGEPFRWRGALSSRALPHAVLACRAAVLNLLADGVTHGIRDWEAVGAITYPRTSREPITVAYPDVVVPAAVPRLDDEAYSRRTIYDLLVKMRDPGETIAELEAIANMSRLGRNPIASLIEYSTGRPMPTLYEILTRRIV